MMNTGAAVTLAELARRRDAILARIIEVATADDRVVAVWLTGSFGRGEDDAWSDFDLHLAIEDAHVNAWWNDRQARYRAIATPLFMQQEKPSNAQAGGHFQLVYFPGPVEVDWNVGPVSLATRPPTSTMLLERANIPVSGAEPIEAAERVARLQDAVEFFWAMAPIAIKYAGRGATTEAVDQIDLLERGFTQVWWLLQGSANLSSPNPRFEPELTAILPKLGPTIDPARCLDAIVALMDAVGALRPELVAIGVRWPGSLVPQLEAMTGIARTSLEDAAG